MKLFVVACCMVALSASTSASRAQTLAANDPLAAFAALPWGIPAVGLSEPASLAALWLLAEPALFFLRPLPAALRRRWELEADGFAASQVGAAAMLAALAKIDRGNKAPPDADPLYVAFCAFHPTPRERAARLQAIAAVQPDSPGRSQPG